MNKPCEKTEVINIIREDVTEIKADVKSLLAYKNKSLGIFIGTTTATTTIVTVLFNLITLMFKK